MLKCRSRNEDWYPSLSKSKRELIKQSSEDLGNRNIVSHEDVMISVKNKIDTLKL